MTEILPLLLPLGDRALLVRFGDSLSEAANAAAIAFATKAAEAALPGVNEIVPNLVSVLLAYDADRTGFAQLSGEVRLLLSTPDSPARRSVEHRVGVAFNGDDLAEIAEIAGCSIAEFIQSHNARPLRVLATGFAPGFVYCGFHPEVLHVPRRPEVRPRVAAGAVLFAAGQTAITSTDVPTGWHVIGHTTFRNFNPASVPPTTVAAGDTIRFEAVQ